MGARTAFQPPAAQFPSPFGVRVLKLSERTENGEFAYEVSVPFRGSCFEIIMYPKYMEILDDGVSVPFRGSCFEIPTLRWSHGRQGAKFPSPFGVRVLKFRYG